MKIRVGPIKSILVDMIENAATGALRLMGGGLLSQLRARSRRRRFATRRVGVLASLS
jgi:hypothetical protein